MSSVTPSPRRPQTAYTLNTSRSTRPLHFREHSNDGRHHWTIQAANNTSLLPSPPYSLTISYPPAASSARPPPTARPSTATLSTASASRPATATPGTARRLQSVQAHVTSSRGVWGAAAGEVGGWLRPRAAEEVEREVKERRRRRRQQPMLAQRSQSSVDRVDRLTKESERQAGKAADAKVQEEERQREQEEVERKSRSSRRHREEEKEGEEVEEEDEEDEDDAGEELAIPAGFYYAKQYDFFTTVRQKAERQRRERRKQEEKQKIDSALASPKYTLGSPTGILSPSGAVRPATAATPTRPKVGTAEVRGVGWTEEKEQLVARSRKSDWLVDGWWEMKHHVQDTPDIATASAPTNSTTSQRHAQPLTSALLYPTSPSPSQVAALFPASSPTPPPLHYTPLTPLYLSSRADYAALQPHILDTFALNALTKPDASRSALEQQQLDVWVERLPVVGSVDGGGGGGGRELLRVSGVVRRSGGEDVYRVGEIGTCFYVLLQGRVQLTGTSMVTAAAVPANSKSGKGAKELLRPSTTEPRSRQSSTSQRSSLHPQSNSNSSSRPSTPSTPAASRLSVDSTSADTRANTSDTARRSLSRTTSISAPTRPPTRPNSAQPASELSETRLLTPFSVFGRRKEETETGGGGSDVPATARGKHGWARVRAVLNVSRAFQMNQIGKLADSRTRVDTARCVDDAVLLCVLYSEYDRVGRQHVDRQSRHVVALLRTLEPPLSRLRMRQLHRLARALQPVHIPPNSPLLPTAAGGGPPMALLLLESGSAACVKAVEVVRYGRAAGVALASWQVEERRTRRTVRVGEVSGLAVLGYEAVLGAAAYDGAWRAVSDCHGYTLHRRDFHLLMHGATLDAVAALVHTQRERFKQRVTRALEGDEHGAAGGGGGGGGAGGVGVQRAMSVHGHVAHGAQARPRHRVQLQVSLLPSPFSTRAGGGEEDVGGAGRLMRRRSSVVDVSHLHGRAKQQLHDTLVVEVSFGDVATLQ